MSLSRSLSLTNALLNPDFESQDMSRPFQPDLLEQDSMKLDAFLFARQPSLDNGDAKKFLQGSMLLSPPPRAPAPEVRAIVVPSAYEPAAAEDDHEEGPHDMDLDDDESMSTTDVRTSNTTIPAPKPALPAAPTKAASPAVAVPTPATPEPRRTPRAASRRKLDLVEPAFDDDDESDDDMDMEASGVDRAAQVEKLRRVLEERMAELNNMNKQCKSMAPGDRKKIRNRKASRVSRLKKKLLLCEMHARLDVQARAIAELEAVAESRGQLLARHGISFPPYNGPSDGTDAVPSRKSAPAATVSPPRVATPVPATPEAPFIKRPRGRPSKKAKLAEAAAIVAHEAAILRRQDSVTNGVCLCHDRPSADMVPCTRCGSLYHPVCVGVTDAASAAAFICHKCC